PWGEASPSLNWDTSFAPCFSRVSPHEQPPLQGTCLGWRTPATKNERALHPQCGAGRARGASGEVSSGVTGAELRHVQRAADVLVRAVAADPDVVLASGRL